MDYQVVSSGILNRMIFDHLTAQVTRAYYNASIAIDQMEVYIIVNDFFQNHRDIIDGAMDNDQFIEFKKQENNLFDFSLSE